jgi:DNA polymerase III delta prime subunit
MTIERRKRFIQASQNLNLSPLLDSEKIDAFRVQYGQQTRERLKDKLDSDGNTTKVIFAGHMGSGKSTLLAQFAEEMSAEGKFVAFLSIADAKYDAQMPISNVNHSTILYLVALKLMLKAEQEQVKIPTHIKKNLEDWFLTTKTKAYSDGLKTKFGGKPNFFNLLTAELYKEDSFREEIKVTYEPNVNELIGKVNEISGIILALVSKDILVIIDDLDKLSIQDARAIFHENLTYLIKPKIQIIFTVPIAIIRDAEVSGTLNILTTPQLLSVPQLFSQHTAHKADSKPSENTVDTLQALLRKRIDADLIEEQTIYKIVLFSGGLLRELMRLSRQCCEECLAALRDSPHEDIKIDDDILLAAVTTLRKNFARTLGTNDFRILCEVYKNFVPEDTMEPAFLNLLHNLYVLEYENGDIWYDLHPIIVDLLQRRNYIPPMI